MIHGGDIYRNKVELDFSVNTNPYGIPDSVQQAMYEALADSSRYPDPECQALREALGAYEGVPVEMVLCGNGASELFAACVHALHPTCAGVVSPSFYGYEWALGMQEGCEIRRYALCGAESISGAQDEEKQPSAEETFLLNEAFLDFLTEDLGLLFLANPNNPTGRLISPDLLERILTVAGERQIKVVLDECFYELTGATPRNQTEFLERFPHVLLVKAFTKSIAIPGVRIGYLLCSDSKLRARVRRQLPEWNVSGVAQAAGIAAAGLRNDLHGECTGKHRLQKETQSKMNRIAAGNGELSVGTENLATDYIAACARKIAAERQFLTEELSALGIRVFPGDANFLLLWTKLPLYEMLLERGILIRHCANFAGLDANYYRVAVRTRAENERLIRTIKECTEQ